MKMQLIVSALLLVGLALVGGTVVVSAAPPDQCAPGNIPGQTECQVSRVYQYDPDGDAFTWFQFPAPAQAQIVNSDSQIPAAAPALTESRVYQYDPDGDAFTWFQFPRPSVEQAPAPTLPAGTDRMYDNGD